MSAPEPLEVERLLTDHARRTVAAHQAFRESLATAPAFDEIDEMVAGDPILDRLPAHRSYTDRSRLESILDELDGRPA